MQSLSYKKNKLKCVSLSVYNLNITNGFCNRKNPPLLIVFPVMESQIRP